MFFIIKQKHEFYELHVEGRKGASLGASDCVVIEFYDALFWCGHGPLYMALYDCYSLEAGTT